MKADVEFRVFWTDYRIRDYINKNRMAKGLKRLSYNDMSPELRKNMTRTLNDPNMLNRIWKPNLFYGTQRISIIYFISLHILHKCWI